MENNTRYPPYGMNFAAGILILAGWSGLYYLVRNVRPDAGPRWYFFILLYVAMVGTSLPVVRFLNMRFSRNRQVVTDAIILRQSLWFALFMAIAAWLQILRVLGPVIAILLVAAFVAIEAFLRVRENMNLYEE